MQQLNAALQEIEAKRQHIKSLATDPPDWDSLNFRKKDFDSLSFLDQRALLRTVIETIEVFHSYAIITYRFPRLPNGDRTSRVHLPRPQRGTAAGRKPRIITEG